MGEIWQLGALELATAIRNGRISAREATQSSLDRIARHDGRLKAFITIDAERALSTASDRDAALKRGDKLGPLHGVPIGIKDVTRTAGLRTTRGSILHRDFIPADDELVVARLRSAGAVIVGKTNTPEFAFGAVCTNRLQGPTANPWDMGLTSGGSSGGSAAAVAVGMVPLAHGTDFGGSVRTPASFCGCVGLRPTPGRIADPDRPLAWNGLATHGVLARSVADAGAMLSAVSGPHHLDPTSLLGTSIGCSQPSADAEATGLRVAASESLNGSFRISAGVATQFHLAIERVVGIFGGVTMASPELVGASAAFKTLRAALSWRAFGTVVERHATEISQTFAWNVREGRHISADDYLKAEEIRARAYRSFARFFQDHDVLVLPAASVMPFPHENGEVTKIDGEPCETIIDYLACTYLVSLVGFPSVVIPAAWTTTGLAFGIQLVGRPYQEATLLRAARVLEENGFCHRWPPLN